MAHLVTILISVPKIHIEKLYTYFENFKSARNIEYRNTFLVYFYVFYELFIKYFASENLQRVYQKQLLLNLVTLLKVKRSFLTHFQRASRNMYLILDSVTRSGRERESKVKKSFHGRERAQNQAITNEK